MANEITWAERQPAGDADKLWWRSSLDETGKIILVSHDKRLYRSTDYGVNWEEKQPAGNVDKLWFHSVSGNGAIVLAYVDGGRLYLSTDYGVSWSEIQPAGDTDQHWYGSAISYDGSKVYVACYTGDAAGLYYSSNYGTNWTKCETTGVNGVSSICCSSDGSIVLACTNDGLGGDHKVYESTNSGVSFTGYTITNLGNYPQTIRCDENGTKIILTDSEDGYYFTSTNGATNLTRHSSLGTGDNYICGCSNDFNTLIIGQNIPEGKLEISFDAGANWEYVSSSVLPDDSKYPVSLSKNGRVFVGGNYEGRLYIGRLVFAETITDNLSLSESPTTNIGTAETLSEILALSEPTLFAGNPLTAEITESLSLSERLKGNFWNMIGKNTTSYTNTTKHSTTMTNQTKNKTISRLDD